MAKLETVRDEIRGLLSQINVLEGSLTEKICDAKCARSEAALAALLDDGEIAEIKRRTTLLGAFK